MPAPKEEQHEADEEYSYEDDLEGEESESDTTVLPNMAQPQNMPPAPPAAPASLSQRPVRGRSPARGRSARSKSCRDKDQTRSSANASCPLGADPQIRKKDRSRSRRRRNKRRSHSRRRKRDDHKVSRDRQRRRKEYKHRSEEDKRSTRATRRREQRHVDSQARGIRLQEAPSTSREAATAQLGNLLFRCQHCSRRFGSEHALEQHQWSSQYCAQKKGKGKPRQQCACGSWITDESRAWQQHYNASPGCDPNKKGKQIEGQQPPPLPQLLPSSSSAAVGTLPVLSSLFLSLSHLTSSENRGQ